MTVSGILSFLLVVTIHLIIYICSEKQKYIQCRKWLKKEFSVKRERSMYLDCFREADNVLFHLKKAGIISSENYDDELDEFSSFLVNKKPKYTSDCHSTKEFSALCLYKMIDRHPTDTYIRPSCNPIYHNRFHNSYSETLLAMCVSIMNDSLVTMLEDQSQR